MIDDDIGLPKSTMNKVIKGRLPENMRIANDASQTIIKCCDELVRIISTTANELSDKEKKSTILPEHILKATEELGFSSFLEPMNAGTSSLLLHITIYTSTYLNSKHPTQKYSI